MTYIPTDNDRTVCAGIIGKFWPTRDQRAEIFQHVDTIEPEPRPPADWAGACKWLAIFLHDSSAQFEELGPHRFTFGDSGYGGALGYLVDLVGSRRFDRAYYARVMSEYNAAQLTPATAGKG